MHKSSKHMVSERCQMRTYTMISFIWRVRTCKSILHEKNQINGCLAQKFVGGGGGLLQSGTKCILGWWILSILIGVLVTQIYSFVKTHQTWCMHYIKCKFQWSWLKNNLEENSRKKLLKKFLHTLRCIKINNYMLFPEVHKTRD